MIWQRQQYIAHCQYEFTGREMFCELFGPLAPLEAEWRAQGATEKEIGMVYGKVSRQRNLLFLC